ncbi:hypothetical protein FXF51_20335 [Nonomuraea sp. PA05]|nr:hypothetical protein FXF51_20335 [Nonomuraea sp. PA05]
MRHVRVPDLRLAWDRDDADLAERWGKAATLALSAALAAGGANVVRYRSAVQARQDLTIGVLRGDRGRLWAWHTLGLWPPVDADAPAREVLAEMLPVLAEEEPHTVAGLVTAVAAAGLLPELVNATTSATLAGLARAAWRSVTGEGWRVPSPPTSPARTLAGAAVARRSVLIGALPRDRRAGVREAAALAALAVLEADPGIARGPAAGAVLAEVAGRIAGARERAGGATPAGTGHPVQGDRAEGDTASADRPHPGPHPGPHPDPHSGPRPGAHDVTGTAAGQRPARDAATSEQPRPGSDRRSTRTAGVEPVPPGVAVPGRIWRTRWGGLLFLIPVIGDLGLPDRVAGDPDRHGGESRPALHELGRRICRRAAPAAGLARPDDPAVLAFAGLPPDAEPPDPPPRPEDLEPIVDEVAKALRPLLPPDSDEALLAFVCHRTAVIEAEPGWIDVLLDLDDVDVDIRRAGLDLDPGFVPWLSCVVRYRYG